MDRRTIVAGGRQNLQWHVVLGTIEPRAAVATASSPTATCAMSWHGYHLWLTARSKTSFPKPGPLLNKPTLRAKQPSPSVVNVVTEIYDIYDSLRHLQPPQVRGKLPVLYVSLTVFMLGGNCSTSRRESRLHRSWPCFLIWRRVVETNVRSN